VPTMDDPFDDIVSGLDIDVDEDDVLDVTTLSTMELSGLIADLDKDLTEGHEALHPGTQQARDKHSLRNALQVELRKRTQ